LTRVTVQKITETPQVVAWRSGKGTGQRSHSASGPRYWNGWPSSAGKPPHHFTKPPRPTQLPTLSGREMSTSESAVTLCGWEVKAGMAHYISRES